MNAKIRNFEFPQVFISFEISDHSLRYLNRRLGEFSNKSIPNFTEIPDKDLTRVRVKIEDRRYLCDSGNPDDITQSISKNRSLHPVKLITLIRLLMIDNLENLPDRVLNQSFCLAWAGENKWYMVWLCEKTIEEHEKFVHISSDTPIIIESDPI